jgi:hypothetical protein
VVSQNRGKYQIKYGGVKMSNKSYEKSFNKNQMSLVETLPINCLKIAAYQSPCNPLRVKNIIRNFDDEQLQPIDVSYRNGSYWIVDGQHRVESLKQLSIPNISCRIHYGLTYTKEASLYVALNSPKNRRTPTAIHRANAQIEAGEEKILEIKKIVEQNGFILGTDQSKAINKMICVATLEFIHGQIGSLGLDRVVRLIRGCWYGIFEAMDKNILMGVYHFVKNYADDFKDQEFIKKLAGTSPREILADGKANRKYSMSAHTPYGLSILYHYNKGRSNKLPNRFE